MKLMVSDFVRHILYSLLCTKFLHTCGFSCQQQAVNAAQDFINKLLVESKSTAEDQVDEELLGKIMRGEETPEINLDDFAAIEPYENQIPVKNITPSKIPEKKKFDRRALLRGSFMGSD